MTWKPDYITLASLKRYLHIDDTADDEFLAIWISTVSRNVDDFTCRQFGQTAAVEARTYTPRWDRHRCKWVMDVDDIQDTTGIAIVDENGTAITGFTYAPVNAAAVGKPYEQLLFGSGATSFAGDLTTTVKWGWNAVPTAVPAGMYLQSSRLVARRDSPFGISGSPSEQGEIRLLAQMDVDFQTSLKPLRRNWWAR